MARITVEDCLDHVDNRFDLVLLATKRARQLANWRAPLPGDDKPTVMALREIAEGKITTEFVQATQRDMDEAAAALEQRIAAEARRAARCGLGTGIVTMRRSARTGMSPRCAPRGVAAARHRARLDPRHVRRRPPPSRVWNCRTQRRVI